MTEIICQPEIVRLVVDPRDREIWPDGVLVGGVMFGEHLAVTPGLSRHQGFSGRWVVTHVPTGHTIHSRQMCIGCAERSARFALESGVDWSQPEADIKANPFAAAVARGIATIGDDCENDEVCSRTPVPVRQVPDGGGSDGP